LFEDEYKIEITEPMLPKVESFGKLDQLRREKEVVGVYISGHPLDTWRLEINYLKPKAIADMSAALGSFNEMEFSLVGIVTSVQNRVLKNGKPFGIFSIEDFTGTYELALFGGDYLNLKNYLQNEFALHVRGRVQEKYGRPNEFEFRIQKIQLLSDIKDKAFRSIKLKIAVNNINEELILKIETLIKNYPNGKCNLEILIEDTSENVTVKMFSKTMKVNIDAEFLNQLQQINNVSFELG